MCDLWKNTLREKAPLGAIPDQIRYALGELKNIGSSSVGIELQWIKLYNSGSFFDPAAIPLEDYASIAEEVRSFRRIIVECHPALVNDRVLRFRDALSGTLEVALGLETAHPDVLERLNKQMTLDQFARAAAFLRQHQVFVRSFVLVKPPFLTEVEALEWSQRSIDFALGCDAAAVSLIPVRSGNGALEALASAGFFAPPPLRLLELAAAYGILQKRGRVFADLWDLQKFSECSFCFRARYERLQRMNARQVVPAEIGCAVCSARS